jgi:DNA-binding transcriptional ArsR family regulator
MTRDPDPETVFLIRDLDTLRVMADPVRMQIFETLAHAPLSPKQLGHKLGLATSKLYYHLNLMEQHGLIRVAETAMVANLQEKRYRTTALYLDTDPSLLSFTPAQTQDTIMTVVTSALNTTREDVFRSLRVRAAELAAGAPATPRHIVVSRQIARIPEHRADAFRTQLQALMEEFASADGDPDAAAADSLYALTVAFYPTIHFNDDPGA